MSNPTLDIEDLSARLETCAATYRETLLRIAELTLALIVADLAEDAPNARWFCCDESDQNTDGELVFLTVLDAEGNTIELDDEGDRYYGDVPLGNLEDRNAAGWAHFEVEIGEHPALCAYYGVPLGHPRQRHDSSHCLDLDAIRAAITEGTILKARVTPLDAARAYGMSEELAQRYVAIIVERDDYLAWLDGTDDWVLDAVTIPPDAPHLLDREYDRSCWHLGDGVVVYDEEPDCVVSLTFDPDRFVAVDEAR